MSHLLKFSNHPECSSNNVHVVSETDEQAHRFYSTAFNGKHEKNNLVGSLYMFETRHIMYFYTIHRYLDQSID